MAPQAFVASGDDTFITRSIFEYVSSPLAQQIVAIVIIYLQAVYINRIVIKHRLALEITLLPGLIYALLMSFIPEMTLLSPHLIANTLILIALAQIFKMYKRPKAASILLNVGICFGVSFLLVPDYLFLILLGVVGVFVLRSVSFKEIFQLISGVILVFVLYFGVGYVLDMPVSSLLGKVSGGLYTPLFSLRGTDLYKMIGILALGVFCVMNYSNYTVKKSIQAQKKIDILFWTLMFSLLLLFFNNEILPSQALLTFIPIAIFFNINFLRIKNPMLQEVLHVMALVGLFYLHFGI